MGVVVRTVTHSVVTLPSLVHLGPSWAAVLMPAAITASAVIVAATISARAARYASSIAGRQAKNEADRLRVELFDRRYDVWLELRDGLGEYGAAVHAWGAMDFAGPIPDAGLKKVHRAQHEAQFLFGKDVHGAINAVMSTAGAAASARVAVHDARPGPTKLAAVTRWQEAVQLELSKQEELLGKLEDHLSLEDIGRRA